LISGGTVDYDEHSSQPAKTAAKEKVKKHIKAILKQLKARTEAIKRNPER
jgi:hypothetical protein